MKGTVTRTHTEIHREREGERVCGSESERQADRVKDKEMDGGGGRLGRVDVRFD